MRFLSGTEIQTQVRAITSRTGEVLAAVAYWSSGAAKRTGLSDHGHPTSVRIICDLLSGACDPAEIEALTARGVTVKTLDRLHAKVWISGKDVIVGSANASRSGLPVDGEQRANVEAATLSQDPRLVGKLAAWFEEQWEAASDVEDRHLEQARQLWQRRRRSAERGFTSSLTEEMLESRSRDRFSGLRLIAHLEQQGSPEADEFIGRNVRRYYADDEWHQFGDQKPWYEWPLDNPEWPHPPGTIFADFSCPSEGEDFAFRGFWQVRQGPNILLDKTRVTLLTRLPHCSGHSLSPVRGGVPCLDDSKICRGARSPDR